MKKLLVLLVLTAVSVSVAAPPDAHAADCEGPAELCAQVEELRRELAERDAQVDKVEEVAETKADAKAEVEVAVRSAQDDAAKEEKMAKIIALAAMTSVILKLILSVLTAWKSYFKSDKGKAVVKVMTLVIGLAIFVATNIGFGMTWWQALILAGGGPAAIVVNELTKMIPVLLGKKKYDEAEALESALSGDGTPPPDRT